MTIKSGTGQACAACKYQRRRCTPECLLAPFFPADQQKMFRDVHKLFGVKHIQNLLRQLSPGDRVKAMKSIKFQAAMRAKNPVNGCLSEVRQLHEQIQIANQHLHVLKQHLAYYQQREQMSTANDSLSELQLGIEPPGNASMPLVNQDDQLQYNVIPVATHSNYLSSDYLDSKENNIADSLWIQQPHANSKLLPSQPSAIQQVGNQDYSEVHPSFSNFNNRPSFIDSKDVYESSFKSSVKDARESVDQMGDNELKIAAACFSLTRVN